MFKLNFIKFKKLRDSLFLFQSFGTDSLVLLLQKQRNRDAVFYCFSVPIIKASPPSFISSKSVRALSIDAIARWLLIIYCTINDPVALGASVCTLENVLVELLCREFTSRDLCTHVPGKLRSCQENCLLLSGEYYQCRARQRVPPLAAKCCFIRRTGVLLHHYIYFATPLFLPRYCAFHLAIILEAIKT